MPLLIIFIKGLREKVTGPAKGCGHDTQEMVRYQKVKVTGEGRGIKIPFPILSETLTPTTKQAEVCSLQY